MGRGMDQVCKGIVHKLVIATATSVGTEGVLYRGATSVCYGKCSNTNGHRRI